MATAGDMEYLDPKGGGKLYVFRFSETGIAKATDYFSKHAMHANAAEEVIYAGEFHVILEGGVYTLYLDNNSGDHLQPDHKFWVPPPPPPPAAVYTCADTQQLQQS